MKLCDFGFARRRKTFAGQDLVGTIAYLSPEVAAGKEYSHKADVWALGVILYEMIFGFDSFLPAKSDNQKYQSLLEVEKPRVSSIAANWIFRSARGT